MVPPSPPWSPEVPHNDLTPPPSGEHLETRAVLKSTVAARTALAQLDQAARSMPNPSVLINTIPILEAQASSEIENIVTTTDALFQHLGDDSRSDDPATRETLRYRTALNTGFHETVARGVTANTASAVCTQITGRSMEVRAVPGTRIANPTTGAVTYSPPEGRSLIIAKLDEWERFVHADDDLDPLVRMAAAHYQFEAIHPFLDGNGRTGRILNILLLVEAGLLAQPLLYLSRYIIDTKNAYYRLLLEVTERGAWEEWILYILDGVRQTSLSTTNKIASIRQLQASFAQRARAVTKGGSDAELLTLLFEQPYCRIGLVMERCGVSRPTATSWLTSLADADLLVDRKVGRDRLFINREFLDLLARPEQLQPPTSQASLF